MEIYDWIIIGLVVILFFQSDWWKYRKQRRWAAKVEKENGRPFRLQGERAERTTRRED